jgi:MFS family permease
VAVGLYVLHNVLYAVCSLIAGILADYFDKRRLLSSGYLLAGIMAFAVIFLPPTVPMLVIVFALGGIYVGIEETLEDSLCTELVAEPQQGMAFGTLAAVNGIGDLASSIAVGLLWTSFGTTIAFSYSAVLFVAGALLVTKVNLPTRAPLTPEKIE